ncbi:MAG TPA: hypothetical protein VGS80_01285, partial [Ktedonobacterales bacterium]|nr:hypothetical protein [Ktedonobacterales bacterium]
EWSDDVEAQLQALYLSEGVHDADPSEEYERRRQELSRRKDNVSRQHELGYLTDEQLAQRMAAIASEEAQLPIPLQRRCNTPQETLGLMRSLGTQWLEADRPQHRVLRYQLANALADRVYVDLDRLSIVGIQFKPDLYLPAQHMLWHRGWHEQTEHPNTLWNPQAQVPDGLPPTNTERVLAALRKGCTTSTEIVQESGVSPRNSVNVLLLRLLREGKVTRERIQREGKEYRYHLAEQTEQVEG